MERSIKKIIKLALKHLDLDSEEANAAMTAKYILEYTLN